MKFGSSKVGDVYFGNKRVACLYVGKKRGFYPYSAGVTYTLKDDTLVVGGKSYTVSGIGSFNGGELKIAGRYKGYNVSTIGASAFLNNSTITSVILQSPTKIIENSAFENCNKLKTVTIPKSVERIGAYAFRGCLRLTDMYYNGTKSEFMSISANPSLDHAPSSFIIHCTDGNLNNGEV